MLLCQSSQHNPYVHGRVRQCFVRRKLLETRQGHWPNVAEVQIPYPKSVVGEAYKRHWLIGRSKQKIGGPTLWRCRLGVEYQMLGNLGDLFDSGTYVARPQQFSL